MSEDIMGVHRQLCSDCGKLLIYDNEVIRQDYYEDGTPSGTTLVVAYKKCSCQMFDPAVNDSIKDMEEEDKAFPPDKE